MLHAAMQVVCREEISESSPIELDLLAPLQENPCVDEFLDSSLRFVLFTEASVYACHRGLGVQ